MNNCLLKQNWFTEKQNWTTSSMGEEGEQCTLYTLLVDVEVDTPSEELISII